MKQCMLCRIKVATHQKLNSIGRVKHMCEGCYTKTSGSSLGKKS